MLRLYCIYITYTYGLRGVVVGVQDTRGVGIAGLGAWQKGSKLFRFKNNITKTQIQVVYIVIVVNDDSDC